MGNILVVVDMQKDFVDGALGTKEAVAIVDDVVKIINDFEGHIFVTYDTHSQDYLSTQEGRMLPVEHCIKGTKGWELDSKVEMAIENKIANNNNVTKIEKITFGSVDLPKLMADKIHENTSITLIGLCTDICVVSNALILKANYPEVTIKVDSKCCAGVTPASHDAALATMKACQIQVD